MTVGLKNGLSGDAATRKASRGAQPVEAAIIPEYRRELSPDS